MGATKNNKLSGFVCGYTVHQLLISLINWSRMIGTSGGVVVGLTVQPVQAWKKGRYKLFE